VLELNKVKKIKDLTLATARKIYKDKYWEPFELSTLNNQDVADLMFDILVSCGVEWGQKVIRKAIRDNYGVVMGFDGENNGTWHSTHPQTPSKRAWSHCIYGGKAKLIDGKKYVGFLNSWGEDVGEDGWQWFGEEWFKDGWTSNIWTMTDKPNTFRTKLLDKDGKPRYIPTKSFKFISYLLRRGYTISK